MFFIGTFSARGVENPVEPSEVETRSASLSVLFTDLHGALAEAAAVTPANHVMFQPVRSLARRAARGRAAQNRAP